VNDERDPLDDTLAEGLRALAPSEFSLDADRTLDDLRPRLHRARTHRRLAVSTSVLGALVVVAGAAALLRHDPGSRVDVRGRPNPTVATLAPASSTTSTTHRNTTTSSVPRNAITVPAPAVTTPTAPPTTPGTTPAPAPAAPQTKTYASTGGRITIRFANGRLTLAKVSPAPGYTTDLHKQAADDVEVRFHNASHESRIRVRVENGLLSPEISEN